VEVEATVGARDQGDVLERRRAMTEETREPLGDAQARDHLRPDDPTRRQPFGRRRPAASRAAVPARRRVERGQRNDQPTAAGRVAVGARTLQEHPRAALDDPRRRHRQSVIAQHLRRQVRADEEVAEATRALRVVGRRELDADRDRAAVLERRRRESGRVAPDPGAGPGARAGDLGERREARAAGVRRDRLGR
jgi:hypothetical protein